MLNNQKRKTPMRILLSLVVLMLVAPLAFPVPIIAEEMGTQLPAAQKESQSMDVTTAEETVKETLGIIKGELILPKTMTKVNIELYDRSDYENDDPSTKQKEDRDNKILRKAEVDADGQFEIKDLPEGDYRLNFVSGDTNFDAKDYGLLDQKGKITADDTVTETDNVKYGYKIDEDYFAYAQLDLKEEAKLSLTIAKLESGDVKKNDEPAKKEETSKADQQSDDTSIRDEKNTETSQAAADDGLKDEPMTLSELEDIGKKQIGAATEQDSKLDALGADLLAAITGSEWSFDMYYVDEDDRYHVDKTDDFSLKYQVEFHNSRDLAANEVKIRVPLDTFKYRNGETILPSELAIPMGTVGSPVESKVSAFNYYVEGNEIVFFNYREIPSGANSAWQVLYKNLSSMEIADGEEWSFDPVVTVTGDEPKSADSLTGTLDTQVNLDAVTKKAEPITGKNFGPGLYTKNQVSKYAGGLPEPYAGSFDDYVYVLWAVKVKGNATQPWKLILDDNPDLGGTVVGMTVAGGTALPVTDETNGNFVTDEMCKEKMIDASYYVVTAYPKGQVQAGTTVTNNLQATLEPYDGIDPDVSLDANAKWEYKDYVWEYKGNSMNVSKYTPDTSSRNHTDKMPGWLTVYDGYRGEGKDKGNFTYNTVGTFTGYGITHEVSGPDMGQRIPGTSTKTITVDDLMYARSSNDSDNPVLLSDKDYYFNKVSVTVREQGYDVYEDMSIDPEASGDALIYVMNRGSDTWTLIETVPWAPTINYTLSAAQLADQPYRVKVEHETTNYTSQTSIKVSAVLRADSPVMETLMQDSESDISIQNVSGMDATFVDRNGNAGQFAYDSDGGLDQSKFPGLEELTEDMYGHGIKRYMANIDVTRLNENSASAKAVKTSNDPVNGRVNARYTLTARDGYALYEHDAVGDILNYNPEVISPGRNEVMFYDLLPYGVQFDPTQTIYAGRTTDLDSQNVYQREYKVWDANQVTVAVDKITPDYNGTGRTMVSFKIKYSGADPSFYSVNKKEWIEGWGVSFGAYYSWKNVEIMKDTPNISAFMPAVSDNRDLLGTPSQDNGTIPDGLEETYTDFGKDIDGDGNTTEKTVLYANTTADPQVVIASQSKIEKLVKADQDIYADFAEETAVVGGQGYTYDIAVYNATTNIEDLFIFDRLENAAVDREGVETGFDPTWWHGTFNGLVLKNLDALGIDYTIYYNADRDAPLPELGSDTHPLTVLTEENGWKKASSWTGSLADVKAFAVDLGDFSLDNLENVSIQVKMIAPENADATWAYNNPEFYSYSLTDDTATTVVGNTARVRLGSGHNLEVMKKLAGSMPDSVRDNAFEFTALRDGKSLSNVAYTLYNNVDGVWIKDTGLYSTDANGKFKIKATQKVIFENLSGAEDAVEIIETENPYWESDMTVDDSKTNTTENMTTITFTNTYQPLLYAQKLLAYAPSDAADDVFTFRLEVNGVAAANMPFFYVDAARTDGGIPKILGKGTTDENGEFPIKAGEIIALLPGEAGLSYTITEVAGAGEDDRWFTDKDSESGTLGANGSKVAITNYYKLKSLLLTKVITNQDPAEATQEFTFKVTDSSDKPVAGNEWVLLDAEGKETTTKGTLSPDGEFTVALGGKTVKIKNLLAGETYVIEETESGTLYQSVNNGLIEVTMPKYGDDKTATLTNDYLLRNLSVSKQVLYDLEDPAAAEAVADKDFTMTVTVNGTPAADVPYEVYQDGKKVGDGITNGDGEFTIRHGQTVTIKDIGEKGSQYEVTETPDGDYPQVFPLENESIVGTLTDGKNDISFVNGTENFLILEKKYDSKDNSAITQAMIELMRTVGGTALRMDMAVDYTLEVTTDTDTYIYPNEEGKQVTVLDTLTGVSTNKPWAKNSPINIKPWEQIIINDLDKSYSYRLTEQADKQQYIYNYADSYIQVEQTSPADFKGVEATIESKPIATIINSLSEIPVAGDGSKIKKSMELGSDPVPNKAVLTWRVEEFDGTNWTPKADIPYLLMDSGGITSTEPLVTGTDGKIVITKTDKGMPAVWFTQNQVAVNVNDGEVGDLRVVELLSESDAEWGFIAGYANSGGESFEPGINVENGDTFINSNALETVKIGKTIEGDFNDDFTFILSNVTKANEPLDDPSDILSSQTFGNIPYIIYDQETNAEVGTGVTTANGEITFRGGQYVRIGIPNKSYWTISEKVQKPYNLINLEVTDPDGEIKTMKKLADNLILIHPNETPEILPITLTKAMVDSGVVDARTGELVNLKSGDVVIPDYIIYEGQLRVITATADSNNTTNALFYQYRANITSMKLPSTLERVGDYTFYGLSNCTNVLELPSGLKVIGNYAFRQAGFTGDLIIPDSVETVGDYAFYYCTGFTGGLTLGDAVISIGSSAFYGCSNLTGDLAIPDSVETIGVNSFYNCTGFTGALTIGDAVTSIGDYAFNGCNKLTGDLIIPDSVRTIGARAFNSCTGFTGGLTIGNGVTSIGDYAFYYCNNLTGDLVISDSVETIGIRAFSNCAGFTGELTIGDAVISIDDYAFNGCNKLTGDLIISNSVETIGKEVFSGCGGFTGNLIIGTNVKTIGNYAFYANAKLTGDLIIPDSVETIGSNAFTSCSGLTGNLVIGNGVETINSFAFSQCSGLTGDIHIGNNVITIGPYAFNNCKNIGPTVNIGSGVQTIGASAFASMTKVNTINIDVPNPPGITGSPWGATGVTVNWQ